MKTIDTKFLVLTKVSIVIFLMLIWNFDGPVLDDLDSDNSEGNEINYGLMSVSRSDTDNDLGEPVRDEEIEKIKEESEFIDSIYGAPVQTPEVSPGDRLVQNNNGATLNNQIETPTPDVQSGDSLDDIQSISQTGNSIIPGSTGQNNKPSIGGDNDLQNDISKPQTGSGKITTTIQLGPDNPEKPGHALGYTYSYGTTYECYSYSYVYPYLYNLTTYQYDRHGWVVFNLNDLGIFSSMKVVDLKLMIHNFQMYYFTEINFTLLKTTPYNRPSTTYSKAVISESGPNGVQIGQYQFNSVSNETMLPFTVDLNDVAVNRINQKLNYSKPLKKSAFGIGMYVVDYRSGYSYGFARWTDLRLVVTLESDKLPVKSPLDNGLALGDDFSGYVYNATTVTSALNHPNGYSYIRKIGVTDNRGYFHWEIPKIRQIFQKSNLSDLYFTKVGVRFNQHAYQLDNIHFYPLSKNVTTASADEIYSDCSSGTKYLGPVTNKSESITDFEFDLGMGAIKDFITVFESNDTEAFFGLGIISKGLSYSTLYGPRLVLEWTDNLPVYNVNKDIYYPKIQIAISDANPGNTILVENGTYFEHLQIDRPLTIIGSSPESTLIDGLGTGNTIHITDDNVKLSGFSINGSSSGLDNAGIILDKVSGCSIGNNDFTNHTNAILFVDAETIELTNNSMSSCGVFLIGEQLVHWDSHNIAPNNTVNGKPIVYLKNFNIGSVPIDAGQVIIVSCSNISIQNQILDQGTASIILAYSSNNYISNNSCQRNRNSGIYLKFSGANEISNNSCSNNFVYGIGIFNGTKNSIAKNHCGFNELGIYLVSSVNNKISDNNCLNNSMDGIRLTSSSSNEITNNHCENNYNGIYLESGLNNTINDNFCSNNLNSGIQNIIVPGLNYKKIPVDVVLTLDTSGSMSGQKISDLKTAAINFVNHSYITAEDRIAIIDFTTSTTLQPFTICNSAGKNILRSKIENITAKGGTPLWDKIGSAMNYIETYGSDREPIIIAMTDGGDTSSSNYAPWHNWSAGKKLYQNIDGLSDHDYLFNNGYKPENETYWTWNSLSSSREWRYGLVNNMNVTSFTVGLGITHIDHSNDSWWRFPGGWYGAFAQYESVVNNWYIRYNSSIYAEFGTPEFSLWRIANSSGGQYFYADTPDKLDPIFQRLVEIIKAREVEVNLTISGNQLANNKYGINLKNSNKVNISNNNIMDNYNGIIFETNSNKNQITENTIINNTVGIYFSKSINNTIYHNNFIQNTLHADDDRLNIWNASYPVGGNYWDTWTTPDNDQDGFVDLPFNVSGGISRDYLPFAEPTGWGNAPPTPPDIEVTPKLPRTNENVICNITIPSTDKDGDIVWYIYDWYLDSGSGSILQDGLRTITQNLSVIVPSTYTTKHDVWRCVVTPTDGEENGTADEDFVQVINSQPTAPIISISPSHPKTIDDLVCTVTTPSSDLDLDTIVYTYEWYLDSGTGFVLQPGLTTVTPNLSASISFNFTTKHEVWRCVVTPNDGEENGTSVQSQVIVINSLPTAPIVDVSPNDPYTLDGLVCNVTTISTDLDMDTITYTYKWYVNKGSGFVLQPGLTITTTNLSVSIGSNYTTKDELWRCVVTPHDGEAPGTPGQAQVTILNSAPSQPTCVINPTAPKTSDDLVLYVTVPSTDADLDPIEYTYEWYLDQGSGFVKLPGLTEVTSELNVTIGSMNTTKHDVWRCVVTPSDGTVNGMSNKAEITILNSIPSAIISSPVNGSEFAITSLVKFDASNSTDMDNDTLTYEWDFNYDGSGFDSDAMGKKVSHNWNYYFSGRVALRVKDDDGGSDLTFIELQIKNVAPKVALRVLQTSVNVSLRIAGEKWHDVVLELYENNVMIANGSLTRYPGSPNDQMLHLTAIKTNVSKFYSAIVRYTPEDDPVNGQKNGATPCWLIVGYGTNDEIRLHHTFNVKHPKTYVWKVNITKQTFEANVYDSGPDNLTFYWDFGDGTNFTQSYPNQNMTYPVKITERIAHKYTIAGTYVVKLLVKDNHGGVTTVKISIVVS
jgi:parallel beta-helix repeat protein